ncbi:MAG: glycogen debranching enzyme family protein, partial [Candidatus Dormibacteraeota bacterium]|nr:glycogen debranching enzyme family protein [Candidatus Dormibacteraeota bacterium]
MVDPGPIPRRPSETLHPAGQEWLVANALGGFASSTLAMTPTRRYHGLLVAAEGDRRTVLLQRLDEALLNDGGETAIGGGPEAGSRDIRFRLELGLPVWTLSAGSWVVERRLFMKHRANEVQLHYRLVAGAAALRLRLRPWVQVRRLDDDVSTHIEPPSVQHEADSLCSLNIGGRHTLTMRVHPQAAGFAAQARRTTQHYPMEAARGYPSNGELWSPGSFDVVLEPSSTVVFGAALQSSPDPAHALFGAAYEERRRRKRLLAKAPRVRPDLVLAADQFLVEAPGSERVHGRETAGVIAGYHWFGRWGRDTMISLDGLTLQTGRTDEAACILRESVRHVRRGLIPNFFAEQGEPLYHTADATLWLFHAVHRFLQVGGDTTLITDVLPVLRDIVKWHVAGTDFNIRIDPSDGLLTQGVENLPLTWMDAKVGDWVATPRRGKAVELQALWYNAVRLLCGWEREWGEAAAADDLADHAEHARRSFNQRFWNAREGRMFDVVDGDDGDDASCRPNQLLTLSLEHPILDAARWEAVLTSVEAELV